MDNEKKDQLSFKKIMFQGAFIHNPVLTQAIGVCSIAAIFTTLRLSLNMSLMLSLVLIVCELLSSLVLKKFSRWLRISTYMLIAVALLTPLMLYLDKTHSEVYASMGIYLPLLAVNSLIVIRCEKFAVKNSVKHAFYDSIATSVGFVVASVVVGAIREVFAYGTIWGKTVSSLPKLSGMALPFGGLVIIGFVAAFHKWLIQKKFRGQPTNSFNLKTALEEPTIHEEGVNITSGTLSFLHDPETKEKVKVEEESDSYDEEIELNLPDDEEEKEGEEK